MAQDNNDERRGAVARVLETDLVLGIRHAPLIIPLPAGPRNQPARAGSGMAASAIARPTPTSAVAPVSGPVASNEPKVVRLDLPADEYAVRQEQMGRLTEQVQGCHHCHLSETRTKVVPGQGDIRTRLVFVGEAPGFDEDQQGLAFVGKAGQLLTKMIEAMGLSREWVYICNILKCRPPGNRTPAPDEINACWPYLNEQLRIIQPEIIVALGKPASQTLLHSVETIGRLRGEWHEYYLSGVVGEGDPVALMPTYHPAYLLRNPPDKGKAWSDLKQVMARLGLDAPGN